MPKHILRPSAYAAGILAAIFFFGSIFTSHCAETPETQKLRAVLDAPPPDPKEHSKPQLAQIYLERSRAAISLGEPDRELKELQAGIQAVGPKDQASFDLHFRLSVLYLDGGDLIRARAERESALATAATSAQKFFLLGNLVGITTRLLDREAAGAYLGRAESAYAGEKRGNRDWSRFGALWDAAINEARGNFNSVFGYFSEAEPDYRSCATAIRAYLGKNPDATAVTYYYLPFCTGRFVELAARLGHLREAGAYVNDAREAAKIYAQKQQRGQFVTRTTRYVARVYLEQGLLKEAKSLLEATITQAQAVDNGEASVWIADARYLLALSEMTQGNWQKADDYFRARRDGLRAHPAQADELNTTGPDWGYALLRLGRLQEALETLDSNLRTVEQHYDERSLFLWEGRAFHALGDGSAGRKETAVRTLSAAVPKILELGRAQGATETGYLSSARLGWILDGYVALLGELQRSGARVAGIDPGAEAFRIADLARGSRVQKALSAAIVRASINDPQLAAGVRKVQDLEYQLKATSEALTALQGGEKSPEKEKLADKIRSELERLRDDNEKAQAELKRKMPDYSELLDPKSLTVAEAQKLLKPGEALLSIYFTEKQTLVWAVPARGQVSFQVEDLPASKVSELVVKLRRSLDPSQVDISEVPAFDFDTAYDLYQQLLAPVAPGWRTAKELIVVPHGALSELPFSVLVTGAYKPDRSGIPFSDHAAAPWLLKQAAISYLPSLAALASLRRASTRPPERAFIGFGDPVFAANSTAPAAAARFESRGLVRRSLKTRAADTGAASPPPSSDLDLLQSLPDTAQEIRDIAGILNADGARDIYLGRRASEQNVKSADLARYRIVMFATHGLVPGDLPGLNQPALALSNPAVTGEKEDGLLTLSEILALKLSADWVVLSACNTASPDGQAAESVSGLGRAFFFAGAKALLVSHWPVETVSARLLTTGIFRRQVEDPHLGRAETMREASLAVMSSRAEQSQPYSYAHPMFWAPFVVIGDGG